MFENIRIILVNTSISGNIGATARAMKTMGLSQLYLVKPAQFPSGSATAMAAGADDVLNEAVVVKSLEEAIADCHWAVASSGRVRRIAWPEYTPESLAQKLSSEINSGSNSAITALVFGNEQSGLSNEELHLCHAQVKIPSDPEYGVLNLAQAVQIICYEVRKAFIANPPQKVTQGASEYATAQALESLYQHMNQAFVDIGFYPESNPRQVMNRLRRLFSRTRLEDMEVRILRGILAQMQWCADRIKQLTKQLDSKERE